MQIGTGKHNLFIAFTINTAPLDRQNRSIGAVFYLWEKQAVNINIPKNVIEM